MGGAPLAKAVITMSRPHCLGKAIYTFIQQDTPIEEKALRVATRIYGAEGINIMLRRIGN